MKHQHLIGNNGSDVHQKKKVNIFPYQIYHLFDKSPI